MHEDTRTVRESEALAWPALTAYLRERLPQEPAFRDHVGGASLDGPLSVEQFGGGHSNLTYLLQFGDVGLVLRRPPLGPVPPRAHDMAREFRWLSALHPRFPLAPRPLLLCEDETVVGAVFYVMERRRGLLIRHTEPPLVAGNEAMRRAIGLSLVDTLAALHGVDVREPDLASLGRPAGFVTRQVQGWTGRWIQSRTEHSAEMNAVADWLAAHLPPEPERPSVVHGDFKLDNVMLDAADPTKVVGVLDWEMCALGDPLVDLGILLGYWLAPQANNPDEHDALSTVTDRPGWPTRQEILDRYEQQSGRDVSTIGFYEVFAVFKLAVVLQQIYVRFVRGQTDDQRFARLGLRVAGLAGRAANLIAGLP